MQKNILVIGGNGLVGKTIIRILKERNPEYKLFIGSRKKSVLSNQLQIDVNNIRTFSVIPEHQIDSIILCVNDKRNNALQFSIDNRIDYIDITKPTPDLVVAYDLAKENKVNNRIVFSSGWMSGIVSALLRDAVPEKEAVISAGLYVYYSVNDLAGESSAHFMAENVCEPFVRYQNNKTVQIKHFLDTEYHTFHFGIGKRQVYNFDVPDLFILNKMEKVPTVSVKMTYSSAFVTRLLGVFQYLQIFNLLSLRARRLIFSANGKGDKTAFDIVVNTTSGKQTISLQSDKGQAELTAFATVLHLEKLLNNPFEKGIYFSHQLYGPEEFTTLLKSNKTFSIIQS